MAKIRNFMAVLVTCTCKNKEDLIKHEASRVLTTLYIDVLDAQGQVALQSAV